MNHQLKTNLAGLALLAVCGVASASPCDDVVTQYAGFVSSNNTANANQALSNHPECFGGGATTSQVQINSTTVQQVNAISSAIGARFGDTTPKQQASVATKSMAAGGQSGAWSAWGSLNHNDTRQSYLALNSATTTNDNKILNTVLGADYALSPTMVWGVSAAFDSGTGSALNNGFGNLVNNMTSKGYTIAPYFGMQINNELTLDASAGLGRGEIAIAKSADAASSSDVTTESSRRFAAANLSYNQWRNQVQWTGKLGYLHAEEDYADSKTRGVTAAGSGAKNTLGQLHLGAQAGYWMDGFMPYAGLAYTSDLYRSTTQFGTPSDPIGKSSVVWTIGINFFSLKNSMTGGLAYSQEEGRTNQKNNTLLANLNIRF